MLHVEERRVQAGSNRQVEVLLRMLDQRQSRRRRLRVVDQDVDAPAEVLGARFDRRTHLLFHRSVRENRKHFGAEIALKLLLRRFQTAGEQVGEDELRTLGGECALDTPSDTAATAR